MTKQSRVAQQSSYVSIGSLIRGVKLLMQSVLAAAMIVMQPVWHYGCVVVRGVMPILGSSHQLCSFRNTL
jgi:hypothetical protein